ncbi:MAG: hypothetical protein GX677_10165 [Treponema sp.]|jgi:hypothetical protein|nr:hypothetical protein [Treponema sp.]
MFQGCSGLTSATILIGFPIGKNTFSGCTNLTTITYTGTTTEWDAVISGLASGNDVLKTATITCSDGVYTAS